MTISLSLNIFKRPVCLRTAAGPRFHRFRERAVAALGAVGLAVVAEDLQQALLPVNNLLQRAALLADFYGIHRIVKFIAA